MVQHIALTKARINLGALVRRVHFNNDSFILEKDGIPVAGLVNAEELEDYIELQDQDMKDNIRASNEDIKAGRVKPAEYLLQELRPKKVSIRTKKLPRRKI